MLSNIKEVIISMNKGKTWTAEQKTQLKHLVRGNTPTRIIALKMGRTPGAIQAKAQDLNISLKPVNQSPYNRKGK